MRYLITGGAGFIGSNYIRYLLRTRKDCEIYNIDKLTYAGNLANVPEGVETIVQDIGDAAVYQTIKGFKPDVIVNFAAQTHVDRSVRYPMEFINTDINGVFNLVYHSMKLGVKRFVHISTDEVYGPIEKIKGKWSDGGKSYTPYPTEADEHFPLNPTSPYAASKAAGDLLMLSYVKTYGFPAIIIRPCNNYGPRQYPEKLIPMVITQLLQDKKIILHGEGKEIREWIYVDDCCRAIDNIVQKGRVGEIYNVGSDDRINNINIIRQIIEATFGRLDGIDTFIKRVKNRPGNDKRYAIDSSKVFKECGEYLAVDFKLGAKVTAAWYTLHQDWWRELNVDLSSNLYDEDKYLR